MKKLIIIVIIILIYIWLVSIPPKDSKPTRNYQEEQERVDQLIDTNCSGPYCY